MKLTRISNGARHLNREQEMAEVKLNRKLNLVLTVETGDGSVYVHSQPISREVFEDNFLPISRAFTAVYTNGLGPVTGPRVAALLLKQEAQTLGIWERTQQSLMAEIYRLTNVIAPGTSGWEQMPFDVAKKRGILEDDTAAEVENCIVYFTCASSIHLKAELMVAKEGLNTLWGAQTTSSNVTEYMSSLQTLTQEETIGESPKTAVNQ
jgi:hypothetical protein